MSLTAGSLFSGYNGLEMAVSAVLGTRTAWVSDVDAGANKILAHRYPDAPNLGDITTVDWTQVEPVDVLTGGFPCQDVSHAGKRAGLTSTTRTGLWSHMVRAIDTLRPSLVVAENVRGLLSARADSDVEPCPWCLGDDPDQPPMRALGAVVADLADIGYVGGWVGLRAADVDACHGRFRVFLGAWPDPNTHDKGQGARRPGEARCPQPVDRVGAGEPGSVPEKGHLKFGVDVIGCVLTAVHAGQRGQVEDRGVGQDDGAFDVGSHASSSPAQATGRNTTALNRDQTVTLLPTPAVNDMGAGKTVDAWDAWDAWTAAMQSRHGNGNGHGASLSIEALRLLPTATTRDHKGRNQRDDDTCLTGALLPTPRATDGTKGGPNQRGSSGDLMLPSEVTLLPTPTSMDAGGSRNSTAWRSDPSKAVNIGDTLTDFAWMYAGISDPKLAPRAPMTGFGKYAAAIARWEAVTGRPAPAPTEPTGKAGAHRLSPAFVEWMMGLEPGWVTDVPGVTRNEALKALGNGVVPQQGEAAIRWLLQYVPVAVAA